MSRSLPKTPRLDLLSLIIVLAAVVALLPPVKGTGQTLDNPQSSSGLTADRVTTSQGDLLIGKVIGIEDGKLRFAAPHYEGEVLIFTGSLARLQLAGKSQESGPMEVELINKDYIRGKVVAITPDSVVIETQLGGLMTISRKVVSSITLAGAKRTLLASDFSSGSMEPWNVRAGNWSVKDKQLVISDSRSRNQAVYAELEQSEALTFVAKVKGIKGQPLYCQLVVFADNIEGDYGRNSVFAQFFVHNCQIGYCQNGNSHTVSRRPALFSASSDVQAWSRSMPGGTVQAGILRLAYDPATGKAVTWLDSNKIDEHTFGLKQTVGSKSLVVGPKHTKGKYVIFISRYPSQISYLRVLRGIIPPSEDEPEGTSAETNTHTIEFSNKDSVSATAVSLTDATFLAQTAHGQLRCPLEEVTSIVFATSRLEKPRRDKYDVLVETAASRLTLQFDRLSDEHLLGSSEHLGQVKLLRSALRRIGFSIYKSEPVVFGIYLIQELAHLRDAEKTALENTVLQAKPIISEDDLVSYNWDTHVLHLKPGVKARLQNRTNLTAWFVVVADGKRCYLGAFSTAISSYLPRCPVAYIDELSARDEKLPENTIWIQRSPILAARDAKDPRSNLRIRDVLRRLGKLNQQPAAIPAFR